MNPLKGVLLIIFAPARFIRAAAQHAMESEFRSRPALLAEYPDATFPPERAAEFYANARTQTLSIRRALFGGITITLLTITVGFLTGLGLARAVGAPSKVVVYILQGVGAAVILGATLGEIGRKIETYGQDSLPERMNKYTFRALYVLGTFLFVVSVSWDAA